METTRLSSKGQIIIPKGIRDKLEWNPGVEFTVEEKEEGILLRPLKPFPRTRIEDVMGCVHYKGPRKSLEEMEAAIAREAKRRK
ncbi:MAG: AbrB/MazE/SpoVT family DNA-binding domain-containing protein [Candidatus Omnitrophica bacterium]|nr:AbrB/MazE/SpoVT family DNA-binding domain-containing protein [Candidatus Omnitrophota bacterium]MCA9431397.1 AbrB/MazE/SpoVT family DNA-binding domain-containing protein [Candidatus Omnitrophota bacterium]MCB9768377.1 AbrB/MazE/SpoVT family DNA-binding domain-containing protein [Candidatus Omnitrophota bacterium]MCB9783130.1 AbrB/MazE/SpoVT family DNA-binding domain-containing protein [Candidatus Omnitrophota bacterium]